MKAKNKEGESSPLTANQYVQIKDPWDEPGKPGNPEITDYDADRIDIAWQPPTEDGGAPIEEYVIEMKDPITKEWIEAARSPSNAYSLLASLMVPIFIGINFFRNQYDLFVFSSFAFFSYTCDN